MILRKLLASSTPAIVATLITVRARLEQMLVDEASAEQINLLEQWVEEDDLETDYLEEEEEEEEEPESDELLPSQPVVQSPEHKKQFIQAEIDELTAIIELAHGLRTDTKAQSLLTALQLGFASMAELGASRKAIIFTESKRTQEYLHQFLSASGYDGKLVLFSGTNNHPDSTLVYQQWLTEHKGTDRITGSPR